MSVSQKNEQIRRQNPSAKTGFASAMVLAAGLALSPGCKNAEQAPSAEPQPSGYSEVKRTVKGKMSASADGCEFISPATPALNIISYPKGKCIVHEGDGIFNVEFMAEKAGYLGWKVSKIDDKGIELSMKTEIFMSEHASGKDAPLRINYGETKSLVWGEYVITQSVGVKAERGAETGTAIVSIVPSPATDVRQTDLDDQRALQKKIKESAGRADTSNLLSKLEVTTDRRTIKVGDALNGGLFDNTTVPFKVTKIDGKGIESDGGFAFDYGKPYVIGEFLLTVIVRVEKGAEGTAIISITHPVFAQEAK